MDHDLRSRVESSLSGTYAVERELGGGGMSRVFVAEETALGRKVVVKVLSPDLAEGISAERFIREIRVAARLQQANIVPVLRAGELDGIPYYTMPYVTGESLRAALTATRLSTPRALAVLHDVAKALAYAHGEGIVHRDIKPENVLLSSGTAVVTDFGIAKAISDALAPGATAGGLTALGVSLGTPAYMAPEQAAGDPATDARADIYAWGVMAYEVLAGRHPFSSRTSAHDLIRAHMAEVPEHIATRVPGLAPPIADLVMRCLAKSPEQRPGTAGELLDVIDSATSGVVEASSARPLALWGALAIYVAVFAGVATIARLSTTLIGLPGWVFPAAVVIAVLGLPVVLLTALVERQRAAAGGGRPSGGASTLATRFPRRFTWRRTTVGSVIAGGLFVAVVVADMALRSFGVGPFGSLIGAKALAPRDRVVIADMRGPSSDTALGSVFAEGMRVGLSESNAIRLVSVDAVKLALEQMRRPAGTLTLELAREVAARAGAKAILDGDVRRVGSASILTIRLLPATAGEPLVTMQETARDDADFSAATGRLTNKLRARIGESLRRVNAATPLEQATTSSLPALRKYTTAVHAALNGDYLTTMRSLREAIAIDSEFVTAYTMLGSMINQLSGTRQSQSEMLQRAYDRRHRLTEFERIRVEMNYWTAGPKPDLAKAIAVGEGAPEQYRDYVVTFGRLSDLYVRTHNYAKAIEVSREASLADSAFVEALYDQARAFAELGQLDSAQAAVRRFARIAPTHPIAPILQYALAVRGGQDSVAWSIARALEGVRESPLAAEFGNYLHSAVAARAGRLKEATAAERRAAEIAVARGSRVSAYGPAARSAIFTTLFLGDTGRAMRIVDSALNAMPLDSIAPRDRRLGWFAPTYAFARRADRVRDLVKRQERDDPAAFDDAEVPVLPQLRARLAEAEGRFGDAVRYFHEANASGVATATWVPTALAFLEMGQKDSAAVYLERYVSSTSINLNAFLDAYWLAIARQRLAELYEERGAFDKAYVLYAALVEQWRYADPELQPQVAMFRERMHRLERRRGG